MLTLYQYDELYQWDVGKYLVYTPDSDADEITSVHFDYQGESLVIPAKDFETGEDGETIVRIPNVCLQTGRRLEAFEVIGEYATVNRYIFNIRQKSKPSDYVYEEDEIKTWTQLAEEIREMAEAEAAAEEVRTTAEADRETAEAIRESQESARQDTESARVSAESGRADAEATRVANEATRQSNESTRESNESTRQSNEQTRQSNEAVRATAESGRVTAEEARASAESARATAEAARVSAESARVSEWSEWSDVIDSIENLEVDAEALEAGSGEVSVEKQTTQSGNTKLHFGIAPGADGVTPVKGVDYFTNADKLEIADAVLEQIDPGGEGTAHLHPNKAIIDRITTVTYVSSERPAGLASGDLWFHIINEGE